jgi:hypothetical protein
LGGGAEARGPSGLKPRAENRLLHQAVTNDWPVPAERRAEVVAILAGHLDHPNARVSLGAVRGLIACDRANMRARDREHRELMQRLRRELAALQAGLEAAAAGRRGRETVGG